jgi:hypothetical protein
MPSREAVNKQKVYTKLKAADAWVEDKTLFWTGGSSAKGTSQNSFASLIPITPDGINVEDLPITQAQIDEAKLRMQFGLEDYLGITDLDAGMPKGKWILVTKLDAAAIERPRFIGQAWTVNRSFDGKAMTNTAVAMGYDMILSMYNPLGAVMVDTAAAPIQFDTVPAIFNERARPNRSTAKNVVGGADTTYIFDYQVAKDWDGDFWNPEDVVEYYFNRLKHQGVYPFHNGLTNSQLVLEGPDPFTSESKIRDYDPNETSIWAIMTQMVETNGLFTTTIKYTGTGTSSYAKIGVIENG